MTRIIAASFATRRDADMAVEHIVQEHGLDGSAITITPAADRNSAGTSPAGGDLEAGQAKRDTTGEPALAGRLIVSAQVGAALVEKVRSSFATYGGKDRSSGPGALR